MISQAIQSPAVEPLTEGLCLQFTLDRSLPVLLPAPALVEILTVAIGQIVPIFQMPPWVMGVHNWRGEVLWIVDLNHLLGFTPWYEQTDYGSQHTVIVLQEAGSTKERVIVGLAVNQVKEVVQCSYEDLQPLVNRDRQEADSPTDSFPGSSVNSLSAPPALPELSNPLTLSRNELTNSLPDALAPELIDRLSKIQHFLCGYWQSENHAPHWLLNHAAILQSLSKPFLSEF